MPRLSQETINEIRQKADIVDIVKEYIPLTQKGKNYFGVCPFHQDHSPSMSVSRERQLFKCFSCGMAGNVFKFVSEYENISYLEAVAKVAGKVGMPITITKTYTPVQKYQEEYELMNLASLFYENNLNTEKGLPAKSYLKNRGLNDEMIKDFNIGLSFANNSLFEFFQKKNINPAKLVELGLLNQVDLNYQDVFRNRILFPIHNDEGRVVGFTGRVYESDSTPKYLNSRETKLFRKGNILFNYHRARDAVRLAKRVILVEGNMDAIRMYASGFKNTIALMGTSLTHDQIVLLKKLRVPVILMLDNDNAGELATYQVGLELEKEEFELEVVRLSGKKDPDEYIVTYGIEAMQENIDHPLSFLEFKLNFLKKNKNLQDTNDLANYVKEVLKTLEGKDAITIDITLNKLVQEYNLSYDVLKEEIREKVPVKQKETSKPVVVKRKNAYVSSAEHILYYMMNDAKYIKMYQNRLGYFKEEVYRGIANEIIYYYEQNKNIELADFLSYVEISPLKEAMSAIIQSINDEEIGETKMEDYIFHIKMKLWEDKVKELKESQKKETDIHKKGLIGEDIVNLKKKIQELKEERSVKND